jgi:hypothetical protein
MMPTGAKAIGSSRSSVSANGQEGTCWIRRTARVGIRAAASGHRNLPQFNSHSRFEGGFRVRPGELASVRLLFVPSSKRRFHGRVTMPPFRVEQILEIVLKSKDVGRVFVAGFFWLEAHDFDIVDRWIRIDSESPIRGSDGYLRAYPHIERLLDAASSASRNASTILSKGSYGRLRELMSKLLSEAQSADDAGFAVLALLVAIDERFGTEIRRQYYRRQDGTRSSVPLSRDRAMPRPWPAFGTGGVPFQRMAPATGINAPRLFLEHQFARVVVPSLSTESRYPRPALHRSGEIAVESSASRWTVATLDVLSAPTELAVGEDADHFWITRYESPQTEQGIAERLDWALDRCNEEKALLVVIPELSLSRALVAQVASKLGRWPGDASGLLPMVIAGQLHDPTPNEAGRFRNQPAVITPDGVLAWEYWKVRRFQAPHLGGKWEACAEAPEYLVAIDTPLGRIAVTICLDFPDRHMQTVLRELRASVAVVPSMTPGRTVISTFYNHAEVLTSDSRAATIFSNSSLHPRAEIAKGEAGTKTLSFVRGNTSIPRFASPCLYEFVSPEKLATVCIYGLRASIAGGLEVLKPQIYHLP